MHALTPPLPTHAGGPAWHALICGRAACALQVPPRVVAAFHELYGNYKAAILSGASPGADEGFVARVMASVRDPSTSPSFVCIRPCARCKLLEQCRVAGRRQGVFDPCNLLPWSP